ncbi:related to FLR1-Putative H+ antiporter regulated by yAP-1 and involved in multidrug resistance [Phialocephala subalpina]|uniref:Related to FLR1-Putative H+ antiporter regulated by yAP-1 and involved in multidrug resistance n=1 Tax=Phialocephala subalpina TaxID=576137 RepID=A0A1L7WD00_9HELO|nr:related to FLR1-Putative H+ antiporter regulated by yAP-1 and involved in multidrug resistance [Phialocephala subalpina]
MYDIIRDSSFGQILRFFSRNKMLPFSDELPGFELPSPTTEEKRIEGESEASTVSNFTQRSDESKLNLDEELARADNASIARTVSRPVHPVMTSDGVILIDWYTTDDPDHPMNYSTSKKIYVSFLLALYTFAVYIGSSIYTPGMGEVEEKFDVSPTAAALGMSLYVLACMQISLDHNLETTSDDTIDGIGPMLWSPLSEIPVVGKNPPYIWTFAIFVILTVPTALTDSFAGLLICRFLLGFFGSPCLATAGASFQDLWPLIKIPYLMVIWAGFATLGPAFGPVVGGFSVQLENWRWTQWEMLWLSGPVFLLMFFSLPETSAATILLQRARRLRKSLDKANLKSQSEIDQAHMTAKERAFDALIKPWEINALDPAVLFSTFYTSLLYGIFYSFFESTPEVFPKLYHFNLGESGLPYLSALVAILVIGPTYAAYWHYTVERPFAKKGFGTQEDRLVVGLVGSCMIPVGLFLYAWTARASVHWIAPTFGMGLSVGGTYLIIQSIFLYLPFTYPKYSASLFAANDLARSTLAAGAILFSRPLFLNLGVAGGVSLLGGLTIVCALLLYLLYRYGAILRAKSRFAVHDGEN